jgi:2-aminomuconate deaminase
LDIKEQTKAVIQNIKSILELSGATLNNLVDLTVFLKDMNDYNDFNEVYNQFFDAKTGPSRTTVAVKDLPSVSIIFNTFFKKKNLT